MIRPFRKNILRLKKQNISSDTHNMNNQRNHTLDYLKKTF